MTADILYKEKKLNVDTNKTEYKNRLSDYTYIDLFAGIGGFRLAFDSYGAECVFTSEWDKYAQEVYFENFGDMPNGDITKINEKDIPKHDILCAGFPCQAFSISGKKEGFNDARGTLFFDVARITKYHKPKMLFLENVKNFKTHDNGNTLERVLNILNDLGYDVYHKILNANNYGVPQARERIYILAFRKDLHLKNFSFPSPKKTTVSLRNILLADSETEKYVIERDDIAMFPQKKIKKNLFGEYPQKSIRIGTVNKGGQGERIYDINGHAITLSAYGGGVGAKTGLYLVNGKIRRLAPRECARLMGLPENFKLSKSKTQVYKQLGNSVVVPVLRYIIEKLIADEIL